MKYRVVFDILDVGYKAGGFAAFGLIFIVIGALALAFPKKAVPKWSPAATSIFAFLFLGFAILWTTSAFVATYSEYCLCRNARLNGSATVTEGTVTNFVPMPYTGHADEKFTVNGTTFSYSDYGVTAGFNNTKSHGGPIDEAKKVRVTHVGNVIVKLEIVEDK